jgi:hypothetical protein
MVASELLAVGFIALAANYLSNRGDTYGTNLQRLRTENPDPYVAESWSSLKHANSNALGAAHDQHSRALAGNLNTTKGNYVQNVLPEIGATGKEEKDPLLLYSRSQTADVANNIDKRLWQVLLPAGAVLALFALRQKQ